MELTEVTPHSFNHLSRFIIVLGVSASIGATLFSSVGLCAPTIDHTVRSQVTKNDAVSQRLSEAEIQSKIQDLPDWELNGDVLQSQRQFGDFVEAIAFVNRLVDPAEAAGHHPDISISYNTVTITLITHDAGGLTEQDFALAAIISTIE